MDIGAHKVSRDFEWVIDEPRQLLSTSPQEYLLSGIGAYIVVGFTVGASIMKIHLESLKIKVKGALNLAAYLDVDGRWHTGTF